MAWVALQAQGEFVNKDKKKPQNDNENYVHNILPRASNRITRGLKTREYNLQDLAQRDGLRNASRTF